MKRLWICAFFAAAVTGVVAILIRLPGRHWFTPFLWPAVAVGSWVSGNNHQPNEAAVWLTIFVEALLVALLASILWRRHPTKPIGNA